MHQVLPQLVTPFCVLATVFGRPAAFKNGLKVAVGVVTLDG